LISVGIFVLSSRPAMALSAQNSTDHDSANQLASAVLYAA
jgi:hypothetical protein